MVELLKKIIHKSLGKLCSVQTVNAKCGIMGSELSLECRTTACVTKNTLRRPTTSARLMTRLAREYPGRKLLPFFRWGPEWEIKQ
jgi:hypothetical protein